MEVLLKVGCLSYAIGLGKQPSMPLINLEEKRTLRLWWYVEKVHTRGTSLDEHIADHSGGPVMQE